MSVTVSVTGRKEIVQAVKRLTEAMTGEAKVGMQNDIMDALGDAANLVAVAARANARAVGAPPEVVDSIFTYRGNPPLYKKKRRPAALVGVAKRDSMVTWRAGKNPKSPRAKVAPGGMVAMSRAAMFEFGTTRQPATAFFSRALKENRKAVRLRIQQNLTALVARAGAR